MWKLINDAIVIDFVASLTFVLFREKFVYRDVSDSISTMWPLQECKMVRN
jgi:hypothetical protein